MGVFRARSTYAITSTSAGSTEIGDMNNDGFLDVVSVSTGDTVGHVLINNGDGTFRAAFSFTTGANPDGVSLGDFNGDGYLDEVHCVNGSGFMEVRLGLGDGTLAAAVSYIDGQASGYDVSIGDFNRDGIIDIASTGTSRVTMMLGNGNGTFKAASITATISGGTAGEIQTVDINGDGYNDLLSTEYGNNASLIFLGNGNGTFKSPTTQTGFSSLRFIGAGDLNGDGAIDIVGATYGNPNPLNVSLATAQRVTTIPFLTLTDRASALSSLEIAKGINNRIALQLGTFGASSQRAQIAAKILNVNTLNYRAAEGRIMDADVAAETSSLIRGKILQQLGSSVLAQANQQPQIAFQLIRG